MLRLDLGGEIYDTALSRAQEFAVIDAAHRSGVRVPRVVWACADPAVLERDFLIKRKGSPYLILNTSFSAAMLDLANPDARAWIKEVIKDELIATGASGWMADFGEALPFDAAP